MAGKLDDDQNSLLTNIGDMIDLAIGTPEVGVVDFGMLHTVLHCLAQQLRVLGKNVELRGNSLLPSSGKELVQSVEVTEYVVDTEEEGKAPKIIKKAEPPPPSSPPEPETILVVERIQKKTKDLSPTRSRSPPITMGGARSPTKVKSGEKLSLVTMSKFNLLEGVVEDLKNRVYGSIPTNEDILEEVRSQTNLKAITDMWTSLNVSSRLEAAETGIAKLSSLVQDAISEGMQQRPSVLPSTIAPTSEGHLMQQSQLGQPSQLTQPSTIGDMASRAELHNIQEYLQRLRGDLDNLINTFYSTIGELQSSLESVGVSMAPPPPPPTSTVEMVAAPPSATETIQPPASPPATPPEAATPRPARTLPTPLPSSTERRQTDIPRRFSVMTAGIMERINELEKRLNKCCDSIGKNDGVVQDQETCNIRCVTDALLPLEPGGVLYTSHLKNPKLNLAPGKPQAGVQVMFVQADEQMNSLQDQLEYLSKQVAELAQELSSGKLSPDLIKDLQGLMKLFQTVQEMQEQLRLVHDTALQLAAEKEDRQYHMDALLEQIELLKTIKLDREDMIEAMADKADLRMLARKVSHDQFELACDDLSRGIDHALGKLNTQEALWQQALDDIQREIEMKLDKMELSPVKDFFNTKLRQLQDNLKQMAALRKEVEAAGTKRRLLRDVQCLSCDANAVMPMDAPSTVPVSRPMPAHMSIKPYLSYELDTIRKAQATNVQQRNLHDWEHIDKQMNQQKPQQRPKSEIAGKHICNRYCGGSHTVTTAAQRVARLGHFIKQWGPDVVPLSSGMAAGDDGRLYKVSPAVDDGATGGAIDATCTPKKIERPKAPQKPVLVGTQECHCLEGEQPTKK